MSSIKTKIARGKKLRASRKACNAKRRGEYVYGGRPAVKGPISLLKLWLTQRGGRGRLPGAGAVR